MTPHVLKIWNIDGADNYTKIDTMDIITNYFLLYFSKEFSSIRKIRVDGSNICAINKGWKKAWASEKLSSNAGFQNIVGVVLGLISTYCYSR